MCTCICMYLSRECDFSSPKTNLQKFPLYIHFFDFPSCWISRAQFFCSKQATASPMCYDCVYEVEESLLCTQRARRFPWICE